MRQGPGRDLAQELLAMAARMGPCERSWQQTGVFEGYHSRMAKCHRRNAKRLEHDRRGTRMGRVSVGEDASQAAFLVLQHAIGSAR